LNNQTKSILFILSFWY